MNRNCSISYPLIKSGSRCRQGVGFILRPELDRFQTPAGRGCIDLPVLPVLGLPLAKELAGSEDSGMGGAASFP